MLTGWRGAAVLAAVVLALAVYTLWRSVPEQSVIDQLEGRLTGYSIRTLGGQPRPIDEYVRHYAVINPRVAKDLPFTTVPETLREPPRKRLIAGVLVAPGTGEQPGVRRVAKRELPVVVRGGCRVVNVLYDPSDDQIIDVWCNMGDRREPARTPQG